MVRNPPRIPAAPKTAVEKPMESWPGPCAQALTRLPSMPHRMMSSQPRPLPVSRQAKMMNTPPMATFPARWAMSPCRVRAVADRHHWPSRMAPESALPSVTQVCGYSPVQGRTSPVNPWNRSSRERTSSVVRVLAMNSRRRKACRRGRFSLSKADISCRARSMSARRTLTAQPASQGSRFFFFGPVGRAPPDMVGYASGKQHQGPFVCQSQRQRAAGQGLLFPGRKAKGDTVGRSIQPWSAGRRIVPHLRPDGGHASEHRAPPGL